MENKYLDFDSLLSTTTEIDETKNFSTMTSSSQILQSSLFLRNFVPENQQLTSDDLAIRFNPTRGTNQGFINSHLQPQRSWPSVSPHRPNPNLHSSQSTPTCVTHHQSSVFQPQSPSQDLESNSTRNGTGGAYTSTFSFVPSPIGNTNTNPSFQKWTLKSNSHFTSFNFQPSLYSAHPITFIPNDSPPCVVGDVFSSIAAFKQALQNYADEVGFMYITVRHCKVSMVSQEKRLILACKSAGTPRVAQHLRSPTSKRRRKEVKSTKVGCESRVKGTVRNF
jgi:hypothetical protein